VGGRSPPALGDPALTMGHPRQKSASGARGRLNWKLWAGLLFTGLLLVAALAGPALAPYGEDNAERLAVVQTAQGPVTLYAPQPPSLRHWLGTDRWGYDLLSLLLYGARFTVIGALAVGLARVLVGSAVGVGLGLRASRRQAPARAGLLSAIPAFFVVYLAMARINVGSVVPPWQLALIQAALMTLVGIPSVAVLVREKTYQLRSRPFVDAAGALGAGRVWIGSRHVLPLLREDITLMVLHETLLALNLLGQLGIFQLFFGGTEFSMDPPMYYSITHEWAGLIGQARASIQVNQWTLLAPMAAFIFAVTGLFLLLRGLEDHLQARQPTERFR